MGKLLSYTINAFFIFVCSVHIIKVIYLSANPEFAETKMYGKQLKDIEFPIAFIFCVSQKNLSQTYKRQGYLDEEHFFSGQSRNNKFDYGWYGHFDNGSTFETFQGLSNIYFHTYFNKTKYFRLRLSDEVSTERPETDLRLT